MGLVVCSTAFADDDFKPKIMLEPGEVTDVIDAFDDDNGDPFDISVRLNFQYLSKRARITRETSSFELGLTTGGFTAKTQNVGEYIETTSRLTPRIDIGIYKDLAFYTALPIVLANSRRIDELDGTAGNLAGVVGGAPGEELMQLPFNAPDRSGIEHLVLGLDLAIFNQARDRTKPTWVFGAEAHVSVSEPMRACNAAPGSGEVECAHPGDINRNGRTDSSITGAGGIQLEAQNADEQEAGIGRGTIGLEVHSVMSKRLKYVEPYGGLKALLEFQQGESNFDTSNFAGALVSNPPLVGTVLVGIMMHPWENREAHGRLTLDVQFEGEYHSEGRDYSELFDALGSSNVASLRNPKWARYQENSAGSDPFSVVDTGSEKTYFGGLSVVEPYGSYRASGSVTWRASEYFKMNLGAAMRFEQAHGISHDQPCNPDFDGTAGESGPCHNELGDGRIEGTGQPNPSYRPAVNGIGRRFYVDESITYEVFASGTVMF